MFCFMENITTLIYDKIFLEWKWLFVPYLTFVTKLYTYSIFVTTATESHLSTQKRFFCREENLLLHMMMKKVAHRGFLTFWSFKN